MRSIITFILGVLVRAILRKYRPDVIGITGTVGKTSAKDMVALALSGSFRVRATVKNHNTEIGVPLTIIGVEKNPGRYVFGWVAVCGAAFRLLMFRDRRYPEILVLEMGADRPGDIEYLTRTAPCRIGIITALTPVHLEKFGTFERLVNEKKIMHRYLRGDGRWIVVNRDDSQVFPPDAPQGGVRVFSYGTSSDADIIISEVHEHLHFSSREKKILLSFGATYHNEECTVELDGVAGKQFVSIAGIALAVGAVYRIPLRIVADRLKTYVTPRSRMRFLKGIKDTLIIDDTYNASPSSMAAAFATLEHIEIDESAKRIVVLGDMRELGEQEAQEHTTLGELLAKIQPDFAVLVGPLASSVTADAAVHGGLDEQTIFRFHDSRGAALKVQEVMKKGDVVLVKGSEAIRMERVVKEIMAEPERAGELIVRQEKEWQ